jgi:YD repeat-containing protein
MTIVQYLEACGNASKLRPVARLLFLLAVAGVGSPRVAYGQLACVEVRTECQEVSGSQFKTGRPGFLYPQVTNFYRKVTVLEIGSASRQSLVSGDTHMCTESTEEIIEYVTPTAECFIGLGCDTPTAEGSRTWTGIKEYSTNGSLVCTALWLPNSIWYPEDCFRDCEACFGNLGDSEDVVTDDCYLEIWDWDYSEGSIHYSGCKIRQHQLSELYTTAELISNCVAAVAALPYPEGPWSASGQASLSLSLCERCATGTRMRYRFCLETEPDVTYRLRWREVTTYTDGTTESRLCEELVQGTGGTVCSAVHEVLPPLRPGRRTVEQVETEVVPVGSDGDASEVPGAGGPAGRPSSCLHALCSSGTRGAQQEPLLGWPYVRLSLGKGAAGIPAGTLYATAPMPGPSLWNPGVLQYGGPGVGVEVITDNNGWIRQVVAPQAVADMVTNDEFVFAVRFFLPDALGERDESGIYQLSGEPYVVWTFENPDGAAATNRWRVTETRHGQQRTFLYTYYAASNSWALDWPGGHRQDQTSVLSDPSSQTREEISIIREPGGADVLKVRRLYKSFPWGEGLIEERVGPDENPEVTTYHYEGQGTYNGTHRPLTLVVHPDGSWESYKYDAVGRVETVTRGLLNAGTNAENHAMTYYGYQAPEGAGDDPSLHPNQPRVISEYVQGQLVSRRYFVFQVGEERQIVCQRPDADWNAPDNLITVINRYTDGPNQNRISRVIEPNGTVSLYDYQWDDQQGRRTTIVWRGAGNPNRSAVTDGTKTITVTDRHGGLIAETVVAISNGEEGPVLEQRTYTEHDQFGRWGKVTYLDNTFAQRSYACCGLDTTTDRDGILTQYHYDEAGRQVAITRLGITTSNWLDAAGRTVQVTRTGSDGTSVVLSRTSFDLAGRILRQTNALGGVTTYQYDTTPEGGRRVTTTYPEGGTRIEEYYRDGRLKRLVGTAVQPVAYDYGIAQGDGVWHQYTLEPRPAMEGTGPRRGGHALCLQCQRRTGIHRPRCQLQQPDRLGWARPYHADSAVG